jgi:predicted amidophosphoribosyltransferase
MAYNRGLVLENFIGNLYGNDYFLLKYYSKRSGNANCASSFILDFKESKGSAVIQAAVLFKYIINKNTSFLKETCRCKYIVTAPSHLMAENRTSPCEQVAAILSTQFDWLIHIPKALIRTENIKKAASCRCGQRPTVADHLRTIRFNGPELNVREWSFILLDDVYTRGDTSSACRIILERATRCNRIMGIFLGRTQNVTN